MAGVAVAVSRAEYARSAAGADQRNLLLEDQVHERRRSSDPRPQRAASNRSTEAAIARSWAATSGRPRGSVNSVSAREYAGGHPAGPSASRMATCASDVKEASAARHPPRPPRPVRSAKMAGTARPEQLLRPRRSRHRRDQAPSTRPPHRGQSTGARRSRRIRDRSAPATMLTLSYSSMYQGRAGRSGAAPWDIEQLPARPPRGTYGAEGEQSRSSRIPPSPDHVCASAADAG